MRVLRHIFLLALWNPLSLALQASEAGVVDWHKKLIGVPLSNPAPVFHCAGNVSLVLTATGNNVLAALNPANGSIAWRHIFEPHDRIATFLSKEDVVVALSGIGGATLRVLDALSGDLLLEKRLHSPESGHLSGPDYFGTSVFFVPASVEQNHSERDLLVLTNGHTLRRIDSLTGELKWSWASPDQSSLVIYTKVVPTPSAVYLIGLAKSTQSFTLHITVLSLLSGEVQAATDIPSSITNGLSDVISLHATAESIVPYVVWLEGKSIRSVALTADLKSKPATVKGATYASIVDVGLSNYGQFVAVKKAGLGHVYHVDQKSQVLKSVGTFQAPESGSKAESFFTGGREEDGQPVIARVSLTGATENTSVHLFRGHPLEDEGLPVLDLPFERNAHGSIAQVVINPKRLNTSPEFLIITSTGSIQLWNNLQVQWTREESLSAISLAEFIELPEKKDTLAHGDGSEAFRRRLKRQLSDAQDFPQYIAKFLKRFTTGSYASVSMSAAPSTSAEPLARDAFGFRQIIVVATQYGKVFGIDSSNGQVIWSRQLGLGWAAEVGGRIIPVKLFITRTISDGDTPQVALVTQRRADNTLVDTVIFYIDALTGDDALKISPFQGVLEGKDMISGPIVEAYLLQDNTRTVILLDEFLQVHVFPDNPAHTEELERLVSSINFPLRTNTAGQKRIVGHQLTRNTALSQRLVASPTWTFSLPPDEDVMSITSPSRGPVASLGKVLGNRTTLYKYLNTRLFVLSTMTRAASRPSCGLYLIDGAKGTVVYHVTIPSSASACDIKVSLNENWLVYHYFDENFTGSGQAKGYRIVSVELYEGVKADDKTKSSDMSSFVDMSMKVMAIEQSYISSDSISAMSFTSTKFGITSKDLIVATAGEKIQTLARRFLDPRRPNQKPTTQEQEEFLFQYDPLIPADSRRTISHQFEVASCRRIITSPALLESTSLVFAFGLDLFGTRVAPSNTFDVLSEHFNKAQLVLTVCGLAVAIMVTKPMVGRKRLRERWYQ